MTTGEKEFNELPKDVQSLIELYFNLQRVWKDIAAMRADERTYAVSKINLQSFSDLLMMHLMSDEKVKFWTYGQHEIVEIREGKLAYLPKPTPRLVSINIARLCYIKNPK